MGAFHEGHLSLMRRARADCEIVVVSLFVNPTQFNDSTDLVAYPRDERGDATLAAELGVDLLFAPAPAEVYPSGFATTVSVSGLTDDLEGASAAARTSTASPPWWRSCSTWSRPMSPTSARRTPSRRPCIRRLVRDLDMPVEIAVCPTVRAADGLAPSSRMPISRPTSASGQHL